MDASDGYWRCSIPTHAGQRLVLSKFSMIDKVEPRASGGALGRSTDQRRWAAGVVRPVVYAYCAWLLDVFLVRDPTADDLAVERQRLQHDVEAFAILVVEDEAKVQPRNRPGLRAGSRNTPCVSVASAVLSPPWRSPVERVAMSCVSRRQGTHGLAPASADRSSGMGGDCHHTTRVTPFVNAGQLAAPLSG